MIPEYFDVIAIHPRPQLSPLNELKPSPPIYPHSQPPTSHDLLTEYEITFASGMERMIITCTCNTYNYLRGSTSKWTSFNTTRLFLCNSRTKQRFASCVGNDTSQFLPKTHSACYIYMNTTLLNVQTRCAVLYPATK
jgi:hypothetical protein